MEELIVQQTREIVNVTRRLKAAQNDPDTDLPDKQERIKKLTDQLAFLRLQRDQTEARL